MATPFGHLELDTNDPATAKAFYGALFDWRMEDAGEGYTLIQVGEGTGGGLMKNPVPGAPSAWLAYVGVDDVRSATAKARSLGAKVVKDVAEVPGMGWFSVIVDPTGAPLGLWESRRGG